MISMSFFYQFRHIEGCVLKFTRICQAAIFWIEIGGQSKLLILKVKSSDVFGTTPTPRHESTFQHLITYLLSLSILPRTLATCSVCVVQDFVKLDSVAVAGVSCTVAATQVAAVSIVTNASCGWRYTHMAFKCTFIHICKHNNDVSKKRYAWQKLTGHAAGPGHGSMHFLCISRLHPDRLQAVSFVHECNLCGFFGSGYVLKQLCIHAKAFTCRNLKWCHFETAAKMNAQVVCIANPSPAAAPSVCNNLIDQFLSSAQQLKLQVDHENIKSCWACPMYLHRYI